ncbi:adhesin AWP1-like isoform X1 [Miscanthus floridulus]|uniref:adhesin AWP1-like isoform X1 n=1 Tax=Miscanthus floridulus TaxID=154761 RepID=UPI0034593631
MVSALELTDEEVLKRLQKMLKGASVVSLTVSEYCAKNPPLAELGCNFVDPIPLHDLLAVLGASGSLAGASLTSKSQTAVMLPGVSSVNPDVYVEYVPRSVPRAARSVGKRGRVAGSSSGVPVAKKARQSSTSLASAMVALVETEEEEDDDAPPIMRRKRSSGTSSSEALAPGSSVAPTPSSSIAPVLSSSRAPVPAMPLLPLSGGDVFAAVVPPAMSSFGLMRKKIAEPSSSPSLQSTSCQTSSAPLRTESQDSERTGTEVAMRGIESIVADLPAPEVTVAMAAGPSERLALAS